MAAGRGRRFDPSGALSKLLQMLPAAPGHTVLASAAHHLAAALPTCIVMRDQAPELLAQLGDCDYVHCANADEGMAASLVCGLQHASDADGWVIALGDMPYVQSATIAALALALRRGADIAVPVYQGRRGNPVGFSRRHLPRLLTLRGDQGARGLLQSLPVVEVVVGDPGIHLDIDTVSDIRQSPA
ncbi:mobA-like NTP transferase domain protein [Collimonas arenae]|uniref:MobA-like NTP transferase domain protein n=1 Tax=Collimonas arenae TaxID=279058 RepID=A0A127QNH2_9BURK|nr:mobA-like NTP transferase domain protein [Collimonas arenae]AMP11660.1 mobA-like NTP transferase domain protein [Collimonas arenae]